MLVVERLFVLLLLLLLCHAGRLFCSAAPGSEEWNERTADIEFGSLGDSRVEERVDSTGGACAGYTKQQGQAHVDFLVMFRFAARVHHGKVA